MKLSIELDPDVAKGLEDLQKRTGKTFDEAVNFVLRAALNMEGGGENKSRNMKIRIGHDFQIN